MSAFEPIRRVIEQNVAPMGSIPETWIVAAVAQHIQPISAQWLETEFGYDGIMKDNLVRNLAKKASGHELPFEQIYVGRYYKAPVTIPPVTPQIIDSVAAFIEKSGIDLERNRPAREFLASRSPAKPSP